MKKRKYDLKEVALVLLMLSFSLLVIAYSVQKEMMWWTVMERMSH